MVNITIYSLVLRYLLVIIIFFSISCVFFISAQKTIIIISTHSSFEKAKTALINFNFPHSR